MIKVRDYRCSNGHTSEHFTQEDTASVQCPECGFIALKTICSPRFVLEGWSGSFPGAASKWEQRHEKGHADFVKEHGPEWESV